MKKNRFCENLKYLRNSLGISQKEISDYLKLNPSSYSNYESGRREPGIDTLIKISNFLNVEIDKLLTEDIRNNIDFITDVYNKLVNDIDYKIKVENINSDMFKNISYELKKKKNIYLSLINTEIPKKIKEIDTILDYINNQETNTINPLEEFADEITPDISLVEKEETHDSDEVKFRTIYIRGNIAAGSPCYALEEILGTFDIPEGNLNSSKEYFGLKVDGDSMNELYDNGELILVEKTSVAELNDIVIALISNISCEATVKKFRKKNNIVSLIPMSNNPIHKVQIYNVDDVIILGKVLGKLDDFLN